MYKRFFTQKKLYKCETKKYNLYFKPEPDLNPEYAHENIICSQICQAQLSLVAMWSGLI